MVNQDTLLIKEAFQRITFLVIKNMTGNLFHLFLSLVEWEQKDIHVLLSSQVKYSIFLIFPSLIN